MPWEHMRHHYSARPTNVPGRQTRLCDVAGQPMKITNLTIVLTVWTEVVPPMSLGGVVGQPRPVQETQPPMLDQDTPASANKSYALPYGTSEPSSVCDSQHCKYPALA